jgi:hypothetical protein
MKTQIYQQLTNQGFPDGEGFIALPISFINVIARRSPAGDDEAIPHILNEIASSG